MKKIIISLFLCVLLCGCTSTTVNNTAFAASPIDITYNDGIYHIVIGQDRAKKKVKVYASQSLETNAEIHKKSGAELTVNAGFFDPNNSKTISYVVMDRVPVEDPNFNEALLSNTILRRNLSKILNRTEFRVVECDNKYSFDITQHKTPVDFSCNIVESVQGGPMILPELRLEEEFFVVKDSDGKVIRESCSVLHKVARTILGIKDGNLHILIITDEHPMDMYEVQALCKELGFEKAMGLDGGSSTSMDYKDQYHVISIKGDGAGRRLKSFINVYK
ncbi:phosphodiester glycosidase family protein [bacterium]|nr:phosphodiester glycosidase family protein [bacterium]